MNPPLRGLTWDHPRAYLPLETFERLSTAPAVTWDRQPLADFEARPLETLAPDYDLLVVDHPGLGHAVATGSLLPWNVVMTAAELDAWADASVGRTWDSYHLQGAQWALPIDAATQVSVAAADIRISVPGTWRDVPALTSVVPTALCLGGPHALLTLLAMAADRRPGSQCLLDPLRAEAALDLLRRLWKRCDREVSVGDPISVHEAISAGRVDYCPLTYGYASYARPAPDSRPLVWADAPAFTGRHPGSVLGGTGLALSAQRDTDLAAVREWARTFLTADVQSGLVPDASGQPAHRAAWDSQRVDQQWGGYYSATRQSVETAWIRPRQDGWVRLQDVGSSWVREFLDGDRRATAVAEQFNKRYAALVSEQPVSAPTTVGET
ncbi:carbohydrate ABC transporter substrate-binding protein [Ornithinicoccus halotolerans]|uniref:carbohydrate ABC transporter substrate-binding protein n=1 Tax=Ornithinicoccus halotolerans TaxID=1748220 RepID=UPI0012957B1A|nr:carbohydrate ABC transporter substrate-binding protein [Ornithinicoccus halotolerans]